MATTDIPDTERSDVSALRTLDAVEVHYPMSEEACLRVPFKAWLWFDGGRKADRRATAHALLWAYATRYHDALSHVQLPGKRKKPRPIQWETDQTAASDVIAALAETDPVEMAFFGPPFNVQSGGVGLFGASLLAWGPDELRPLDLSRLEYSVAASRVLDDGLGGFVADVVAACAALRPLHGVAGPGVQFDRIYGSTTAYALSFPLAARFPGLHCGLDRMFAIEMQVDRSTADALKIFTINWLTVLSDAVIDSVPGVRAALAALPDSCPRHTYPGGMVVQAGPVPQLGDKNRGLVLDDYRRVAAATAPLRFESYGLGIFDVEPPLDGLEETLRWIRRFD